MALVSRPLKDNGTVAWVTGDSINETDLEGDVSAIVTQVSGNLDSTNMASGANVDASTFLAAGTITNTEVSGSAAITVSKLAQTAGQLDSDIVDDSADDAATYKTVVDPGDSGTPSLPTNLELELQRTRFVAQRTAGLGNAKITDGTNAAAWFDGVSTGANLVRNPAFLDYIASGTTAPQDWTKKGTPTSLDGQQANDAAEGPGYVLRVTSAATADGIQQTLSGLKASARYLVEARTNPRTSIHTLKTTGATGTFGNLDLDSGDGTGTWATLAGLIETDATPTDIVVSIEAENGVDVFDVAWVSVREVGTTDKNQRDAPFFIQTATSTSDVEATVTSDTTVEVQVPGDNYSILVWATATFVLVSGGPHVEIQMSIQENTDVAGVGAYADVQGGWALGAGSKRASTAPHYARTNLTAGNVYGYRLGFPSLGSSTISSAETHRVTVALVRQG